MKDSIHQALNPTAPSRRDMTAIPNSDRRSQLNLAKSGRSTRLDVEGDDDADTGKVARPSAHGGKLQDSKKVSMHTSKKAEVEAASSKKTTRLVRWNAEVLSRLLKQIVARRNAVKALSRTDPTTPGSNANNGGTMAKDHGGDGSTDETKPDDSSQMDSSEDNSDGEFGSEIKTTVLEEVQEIIHLPTFDAQAARNQDDPQNIQLEEAVKDQLLAYVTEVASMYR